MNLVLRPRLQREVWSLYWREPSRTETACLADVELDADASATVASLMDRLAARMGWSPEDGLTRLDGFTAPWQRALHRGRELLPTQTLADAGLADNAVVTIVRIELVAEGWKVRSIQHRAGIG